MSRLFWRVYLPLAACVVLTLVVSVVAIIKIIPAQLNDYRDKIEELRGFLMNPDMPDLEAIQAHADEIGLDVRVTPAQMMQQPPPPDGFMRMPGLPPSYPYIVETSVAPRGGPGGFLRQSFWLVLLLLLVAEGLVLYLALNPLRKRLSSLKWATTELGSGNLGVRLDHKEPGDLIDSIGGTFNRMAAEMETLIASHRELLGIVAHELRTPLTRMRLALELIRENASEGDISKVDRMERDLISLDLLVSELLAFNRLGRAGEISMDGVSLSELAREVIDAESWNGAGISFNLSGEASVHSDRSLIGRALGNLVRNAGSHAVSVVDVTIAASPDGRASVTVSDDGPGYAVQLLGKLGEPFVKGPSESGTGLGLAIALRIAALHGGGLTFGSSSQLGGAEVVLTLGGAAS